MMEVLRSVVQGGSIPVIQFGKIMANPKNSNIKPADFHPFLKSVNMKEHRVPVINSPVSTALVGNNTSIKNIRIINAPVIRYNQDNPNRKKASTKDTNTMVDPV